VRSNNNNNVCIQICAAKVKLEVGDTKGEQTPKKCRKVCHKNISTQPRAKKPSSTEGHDSRKTYRYG